MPILTLKDCAVIAVSGAEAAHFLGATVTCDVEGLADGSAVPGALLTPQGKILFDFMIMRDGEDGFLLDCPAASAGDFVQRLTMYKLRAKVEISVRDESLVGIAWDSDSGAEGATSSRDTRLRDTEVTRLIGPQDFGDDALDDWNALRIANGVAQSGSDYALGDAFPHDVNLDQIGGISFTKGCYVGQEVVSRMQHRGTARRRVLVATADAELPASGTEIVADGRPLGTLGTVAGKTGLALCRIDRVADAVAAGQAITAGDIALTLAVPPHAGFAIEAKSGDEA